MPTDFSSRISLDQSLYHVAFMLIAAFFPAGGEMGRVSLYFFYLMASFCDCAMHS